jgi:hypothetical protein
VADSGNVEGGGGCNQAIDVIHEDFSNILRVWMSVWIRMLIL